MAAGHGGGRKKKHRGGHEEEHENHERWLVSYADMVTLLFALFLVLFAISNVDQRKFAELAQGLSAGFGMPEFVPLSGGEAILSSGDSVVNPVAFDQIVQVPPEARPEDLPNSDDEELQNREAAAREASDLAELAGAVDAALTAAGLQEQAQYRIDERGLVVALVADDVLFANGSAVLEPEGQRLLDTIAPVLAGTPQDIDVEGHANRLPVRAGSIYPSNWELSASRAASVVRHLIERDGLDPSRLTAIGYSDTRPLVPAEDPTSIVRNRRVDVVVASNQPAEVRALLPQEAARLPGLPGTPAP